MSFRDNFARQTTMKMAVGLASELLFIFSIVQARVQEASSQVLGVVGGVVYLSPPPQTQKTTYHQSHWRYGSSLKVAIHENGSGVRYPNGPFKDRLELFPNNTLKISCLQKNYSNTYWVYLEDEVGKEYYYSVYLKVYDVVPKPTVRAIVNGDNPEHCNVTLECWVQLEDVTYEWMPPSRVIPVGSHSTKSTLPLSFNPSLETYTCRASNPVSSSSAQLTRRHPCSWTAESSAVPTATKTSMLMLLGHILLLFFALH
uniref:Ig-like domain-containing protein n=1 Tax=Cairina moschata TaxID=8855 RepID=A0A8C3C0X7_CAIMO